MENKWEAFLLFIDKLLTANVDSDLRSVKFDTLNIYSKLTTFKVKRRRVFSFCQFVSHTAFMIGHNESVISVVEQTDYMVVMIYYEVLFSISS